MQHFTAQFNRHPSIEPLESRQFFSASLLPMFVGKLPKVIPPDGAGRVLVKVKNTDSLKVSETATVRLFASTDTVLDSGDVQLSSTVKNLRLKPGAATQIRLDFPAPSLLADGNYYLLAQVDNASAVAISRNAIAYHHPFSDVAIRFSKLPPLPVELDGYSSGRRFATVDLTNTGNVVARGSASVNVYLSTDGTFDGSDPLLATKPNQSIAIKPGGHKSVQFRVAVPPGTTIGAYFLFAVVTPNTSLTDTNTANNTAESARRIAVVNQLPQPIHIHNDYYYDYGYPYYDSGFGYYYDYGYDYGYSSYSSYSVIDTSYATTTDTGDGADASTQADGPAVDTSTDVPTSNSSSSSGSDSGASTQPDSWDSPTDVQTYSGSGGDF